MNWLTSKATSQPEKVVTLNVEPRTEIEMLAYLEKYGNPTVFRGDLSGKWMAYMEIKSSFKGVSGKIQSDWNENGPAPVIRQLYERVINALGIK